MNVTVLGSQGAIPKPLKFSTSLLVNISSKYILLDCCEGVQYQLRNYKIKLNRIEIILISHAHGDHYFGLIGLISTLSLLKRNKKLTIFCPTSVLKITKAHLKFTKMKVGFELEIIGLTNQVKSNIYENESFTIDAFPLKHSIYTNGFLIKEKAKRRKLILGKAIKNNIDKIYFNKLTKSENVINNNGCEISYLEVTTAGDKPKSFAYCSDTAYFDKLVEYVMNVDLLYCETTFLKKDYDKANITLHSTTIDAANLALMSNSKKLLIGHFSSRYEDYRLFYEEVREIFPNVVISEEGKKIVI